MKIKYLIVQFFLLNIFNVNECSIGCMDNSYHAYLCNDGKLCKYRRHDHKTLHYVPCACPCNEYIVLARKGKCPGCMHYHKPQVDLTIDRTTIYDYLPNTSDQSNRSVIGTIISINEDGILLKTNDGFEGIVPLNQLAWLYNYKTIDDVYGDFHIGDEVQALIISFDTTSNRYILSIKK